MNSGKSTLFNALAGTGMSIVSEHAGTTTDIVRKAVEIHGVGPAVLLDTAGIDDRSELGVKRTARAKAALDQVDLAILLFANNNYGEYEKELVKAFENNGTPFFLVYTKTDLAPLTADTPYKDKTVLFTSQNPDTAGVIEMIKKYLPPHTLAAAQNMFEGIVKGGDYVLLAMPQDAGAPQGRLILPQVQAVRALLDLRAKVVCYDGKDTKKTLEQNPLARLIVTDSQLFKTIAPEVPQNIALTSFSILLSRMKGDFDAMLKGTREIKNLKDGDNVLILESCVHTGDHCLDIGRVQLPQAIKKASGKNLNFVFNTGLQDLPENLRDFALAVQCGGCMSTKTQIQNRLKRMIEAGVPVSNYGMALAYYGGIFERATAIFK